MLFNKQIIKGDYLNAGRSASLSTICSGENGEIICETIITLLLNELKQIAKTFYDGSNINSFVKMIIYNHPELKINELILAINKGVSREYAEAGKPAVYGEVTYDLIEEWIEKFKIRQADIFYEEHLNRKNGAPLISSIIGIAKENPEMVDTLIKIGRSLEKTEVKIKPVPTSSTDPFKKYFIEFDFLHLRDWKGREKHMPEGARFIKYQNKNLNIQEYVTIRYNEEQNPEQA